MLIINADDSIKLKSFQSTASYTIGKIQKSTKQLRTKRLFVNSCNDSFENRKKIRNGKHVSLHIVDDDVTLRSFDKYMR